MHTDGQPPAVPAATPENRLPSTSVGKPSVKSSDSVTLVHDGENWINGSGGGVARIPTVPGVSGDVAAAGGAGHESRGPGAALAAVSRVVRGLGMYTLARAMASVVHLRRRRTHGQHECACHAFVC